MSLNRGLKNFTTDFKVAHFLAWREIKRANIWTTILISLVMTLTFLNLIVVSGILVGLIQGSEEANKVKYTSDVIISTPKQKNYINRSNSLIQAIEATPEVRDYTARYLESIVVEAGYRERTNPTDLLDRSGGSLAGIDPQAEDRVTGLGKYLIEGAYLEPNDYDKILIGSDLLFKYNPVESPGFSLLKNVEAGSKVRLKIGDLVREVTIKGVLKAKVSGIDQRIFMNQSQVRQLIGRSDYNVDEIAIKLFDPKQADIVRDQLIRQGFAENAVIQTWLDAQPKFLKDIKLTFALIGNMIGTIGLVVASITIFIVIFVNAITRRRYIGIMKGIGISRRAIEFSYIAQSIFYAVLGMAAGSLIVFFLLKPYFDLHPINFPFSDGILVAEPIGTLIRSIILFIATIIAGYVPARIVVKQNTLDAILGR